MRIRDHQASDLGPLLALFTASVHGLGRGHYDRAQLAAWAPPTPDPASWAARLARVQTLVAEVDGELAGFVSWQTDGHIDLLFVAPSHARHGVATRLYLEAEAALRAAGVRELTTEASLVAHPVLRAPGIRRPRSADRRAAWRGAAAIRHGQNAFAPGGSTPRNGRAGAKGVKILPEHGRLPRNPHGRLPASPACMRVSPAAPDAQHHRKSRRKDLRVFACVRLPMPPHLRRWLQFLE